MKIFAKSTWMLSLAFCNLLQFSAGEALAEGNALLRSTQPVARRFRRNLPRNHDRGAFFRLALGGGYASFVSDAESDAIETSGLSLFPGLAVGWLPYEQVALHLSAWSVLGGALVTGSIGPGVTYYFDARENTWVAIAIGVSAAHEPETVGLEWSLSTEIEAGIYRWQTGTWSMGASLFADFAGIGLDGNGEAPWCWALGFRVGVVYN